MMKNLFKSSVLIILVSLLFTFLYALSFRLPFFDEVNVYFYRAILLLIVTSLFFCVIFGLINWKKILPYRFTTYFLLLCFVFFMNFTFLTLITVSVDRSISVFILAYMADNKGQSFSKEQLEQIFLKTYMGKYQAMERRFAEQITTGSIMETESGYTITPKGSDLIQLFKYIAVLFPIDSRFLYPEKTEEYLENME